MTAITSPRRRRGNPLLITGLTLFAVIVAIGVIAPFFLTDAAVQFSPDTREGFSARHWLGTDDFGRDMLARTLVATRLTLIMAAIATGLSIAAGVLLGALIWIAPRRIRELGLRILETLVAYPGLLVTIVIVTILGAGARGIVIGLAIAGIHGYARLTANLVAGIVNRDYVTTARQLGVSRLRLVTRHLLPNVAEPLLIVTSAGFGGAVLDLSGLSFIGLGVQTPQFDYGKLLNDALGAMYTQPSQVIGPAVAIVTTILSVMLIGDGLAAAADPRVHSSRAVAPWPDTAPESTAGSGAFAAVTGLRVRTRDGQELVHGVTLHIDRGEIVGLVGESGSGKSITAMSLAGLLPPDLAVRAEELRVGDLDMTGRPDPRALARALALIYQDPGTTFSPVLPMGTQLTEVLRTHRGMTRIQARSVILSALDMVRMSRPAQRLRQFPHELSGGMRQRAMIAAALVAEPEMIIADEPTTGLDVIVQAEILRELTSLNRQRSTTILFISHDIAVVGHLCDRVYVMHDGLIVEELAAADLLAGRARHDYTRQLLSATPGVDLPDDVGAA